MKKIITAILMIMTFISCNNTNKEKEEKKLMPDDIVEKNAEAFLADKLNDPTSYEFVSLKIVDTISFKQNIEEYKRMGETDMKWNEDRIEKLLDYKKTLPSLFDKDELNKQKQELVENKKMLNGIDSIETSLGEKVNQTAA
jgi:uncharacterized lipoprotein NlpE involved in copper resistance